MKYKADRQGKSMEKKTQGLDERFPKIVAPMKKLTNRFVVVFSPKTPN